MLIKGLRQHEKEMRSGFPVLVTEMAPHCEGKQTHGAQIHRGGAAPLQEDNQRCTVTVIEPKVTFVIVYTTDLQVFALCSFIKS